MSKRLLLVVASIFISGIFFLIVKNSFSFIDLTSVAFWIKIAIAWGLFGGITAVSAFFLEKKYFLVVMVGIVAVYFLMFGFNRIYISVSVIFLVFSWIYSSGLHREKARRVKVAMQDIVPRHLYFFITGILIMVSVAYYFLPNVQAKSERFEVPENVQENVVTAANAFLLKSSPDEVQDQIEANADLQTQFESRVQQAVSEVLLQAQHFIDPYVRYVPILAAIGFFLAASALMLIWKFLVIGFASLLYAIFRATNFITIETVQKEVEEARL